MSARISRAIAAASPVLDALRFSIGAWNTEDELARLVDGIRLLAEHPPGSLPPRRTLEVLS